MPRFKPQPAREDLAGELAVVWEDAQGRTRFIAPPQQHPFFQVVNYGQLRAQVNGTHPGVTRSVLAFVMARSGELC